MNIAGKINSDSLPSSGPDVKESARLNATTLPSIILFHSYELRIGLPWDGHELLWASNRTGSEGDASELSSAFGKLRLWRRVPFSKHPHGQPVPIS